MTDRPPSVFIDRAPEVVFGYLIGLNDAGWRSPFPEMKLVSESYEGVGAAHIEVRKVLGRRIETLAETVIYEPDRRWAVRRASGPIRPQVTYTLRPEGNGTRLWFEFGVPVLEGMARRLSRGRPGAISKDSSRLSNVTDRRDGRSKGEHSMTTRRLGNEAGARSPSFERFAGFCAILAGVSDLLYAVSFLILQNILLSGLFLMLGGLLTSAALIAVYERLRETDASFALLALVLGLASSLGSAVHGGYDLANAVNPPPSLLDLPNPVDPRGLLTFGVAGLALFVVASLIDQGGRFPRGLGNLGYVAAILLLALYVGRLIVLEPTSPLIAVPALLSGFIVNPLFYVWLGLALLRTRA